MLTPFYSKPDPVFVRGQGCWLWDSNGRDYIDCINGVGSNIFGHCDPDLVEVLNKQSNTVWQVSNQLTEPTRTHYAERLCSIAKMDTVFFQAGGSESIDLALKLIQWNRSGSIVVVRNSFHGTTLASTVVSQWPAAADGLGSVMPVIYVDDNIQSLHILHNQPIAAVIIEPVLGMGGARPLHFSFVSALIAIAREKNALIVSDECQCGFYRCGGISVLQDLGFTPDILILSKGLANGIPLSACLFNNNLAIKRHGSTYGGTAIACAVADGVLDKLNNTNLVTVRELIREKLSQLSQLQSVKQVRCYGNMIGIELNCNVEDAWKRSVDHGVLTIRSATNTLRLMLPLNINASELDILVERLTGALES
jgi:acetylornithine/N-succinyldiaminopimelate aminotransferase